MRTTAPESIPVNTKSSLVREYYRFILSCRYEVDEEVTKEGGGEGGGLIKLQQT